MWDITVDGAHSFFVTSASVLVHNWGGSDLWTETSSRTSYENLVDHYVNHGADFGAQDAVNYYQQARSFADDPPAGSDWFTRTDRRTVIYDPGSNTFAVVDPEGVPATFFKPDPAVHGLPTNWDYFQSQAW